MNIVEKKIEEILVDKVIPNLISLENHSPKQD